MRNYRTLIIIHLLLLLLSGVFLMLSAGSFSVILKLSIAILVLSLLIQSAIWYKRKGLFDDKIEKHPHQV
jgi:isoprenylcysteine carboxyl methyltransferase (ICMT) family protein YpbQ